MKNLRLREPEIEERENAVVVYIHHAPLASAEEAVMDYLKAHASITNSIARDITGIHSENKMKRVFLALHDSKMIERVPGLKGNRAAWQLYTGAPQWPADDEEPPAAGIDPANDDQPGLFKGKDVP